MRRFIVVPSPGYYGGQTTVDAAYDSLGDAIGYAKRMGRLVCVREASSIAADRGDEWLQVYEADSPILFQAVRS